MSDTKRIEMLRARYRQLWDACQVLVHQNTTLVRTGRQPTNEQLINEQRAATAVSLVRDELLAAMR